MLKITCPLLIVGMAVLGLNGLAQGKEPVDVAFIANCDQTEQRYVVIEPDDSGKPPERDLLIALHGHGSDRWQFINNPRDECRAARDFAASAGMIFLSPDYRAKTSWMGPKAEADLLQIISECRQKYSINRVFVCGGSMGGSSALTFAVLHPGLVQGVAAMNPMANHLEYDRFQEAISESYGGSKTAIPSEYKARSAEYWPERLTMPVGITTGGKDDIVPPDSAMRLAGILKTLQRPILLIHRPDGGHETNYEDAMQILKHLLSSDKTPRSPDH